MFSGKHVFYLRIVTSCNWLAI